jgi:hypothetical protein
MLQKPITTCLHAVRRRHELFQPQGSPPTKFVFLVARLNVWRLATSWLSYRFWIM